VDTTETLPAVGIGGRHRRSASVVGIGGRLSTNSLPLVAVGGRLTGVGQPRNLIIGAPNGTSMDGTPQEITTLVGREIYSNNGVFVGEIEDVRLNLDAQSVTGLAVGQLNRDLFTDTVGPNEGVLVPYRWVRAVGDVVLINDIIERLKQPEGDDDEMVE
jgi:sporulation protein YlmC with PRC-barrel domain